MILTIRTIEQERSTKCSIMYSLTIYILSHLFLSLGLSEKEKAGGVQITIWNSKSRIKPVRTESREKDREIIQQIHERVEKE